MNKQDYPKESIKLLGLEWKEEYVSTGSTVTTEALKLIYDKLQQWEDDGILSIAKGLEKLKK
jgi:hypothetical protein